MLDGCDFFNGLLAMAGSAHSQNVQHDGLINSPLGSSSLSENASGHLVVSNIGSSGLDGVHIELGESNGFQFEPDLVIGFQGRCELKCDVIQNGNPNPVPVSVYVAGDGSGNAADYTPDFSGLNSPTYTLRLYDNGQLVYNQGGHTGGTKMHNGGGLGALPQKVYMLGNPFGPWGGSYLMCGDHGGGTVSPPGGVGVACDFFEFISEPAQVIGVGAAAVLASAVPDFNIDLEELRLFDHWLTGIDDAKLDAEPGGRLKVSNLGSSGCDGVSIDLGDGDNEFQGTLEELAAPMHPGGMFTFESKCGSGESERVMLQESQGQWIFMPDFSQLGSQTYTMELYNQTQLVYQQSGMVGPGVATAAFSLFYKKVTEHADGSVTTEWCIGGNAASAHQVAGGPTVQADMIMFRSGDITVQDADLTEAMLRGGNLGGDVYLTDLGTLDPCVGTSYCISSPNSAGPGALMCSAGTSSIANNDLVLTCNGLPANKFGLFFYGPNQIQTPFGDGFRCVGGQLSRLQAQLSSAQGSVAHALDNTAPPTPNGQISSGQLWHFQFWYRDPAAAGAGFNLSDGHSLLFTP